MITPVALTIAGSDSGGGAGIQADLKTFAAFSVFGTSALTALTAQNTRGVTAIANVEPAFVAAQIDAVAADFSIAAAKTGMLSRAAIIEVVADRIRAHKIANLVVDPVMAAASGDVLLEPDAIAMMRDMMLPLAALVTPNLHEAELLTGLKVRNIEEMAAAARAIVQSGARAALVKGGALAGDAIDLLFDGGAIREYRAPRITIGRAHGAGCTLSAAIAAGLARGEPLEDAIELAKQYVTRALETAPQLGDGARPLNHLAAAPKLERTRR
jgi:hydroxymethylpyrimidine/phosphomethylpyrimidine kinase